MPFFTVVIPLYNKQDYIADTLKTVFAQTFTNFEVIVVNDGSTDNGGTIVKTFNDDRLTYIETVNRGVSAARNTGIDAATGTLIAFLDADDYWLPGHLKELYDLYHQYPQSGILASRYFIKNPALNNYVKPVFKDIADDYKGIVPHLFGSSLNYRITWTSALAVPKSVLSESCGFSEHVTHPEDIEMWIRIAIKYPVTIGNQYTAIYNYEVPGSLSKRKMAGRKIMDFTMFTEAEKKDTGLKAFLDQYRLEYAVKFKTEGDIANAVKLYRQAAPYNINLKSRILFALPPFILRGLLNLKHWLHKKGLTFTVHD